MNREGIFYIAVEYVNREIIKFVLEEGNYL
jgi:hypothetical protein